MFSFVTSRSFAWDLSLSTNRVRIASSLRIRSNGLPVSGRAGVLQILYAASNGLLRHFYAFLSYRAVNNIDATFVQASISTALTWAIRRARHSMRDYK
jgi:hypothetical protein